MLATLRRVAKKTADLITPAAGLAMVQRDHDTPGWCEMNKEWSPAAVPPLPRTNTTAKKNTLSSFKKKKNMMMMGRRLIIILEEAILDEPNTPLNVLLCLLL